ncbi:hypothetical protein L7F22_062203 [Adiantum nelumboides]|nr:hypothetical protein [Adiantum nelumboides]
MEDASKDKKQSKVRGPSYKLRSDIELATNLKKVFEERILNSTVEMTLGDILGIAKQEFHEEMIDIIKRKRHVPVEQETNATNSQNIEELEDLEEPRARMENDVVLEAKHAHFHEDEESDEVPRSHFLRSHWARATTETVVKIGDFEEPNTRCQHTTRKLRELHKWEKQYVSHFQSEMQGCIVLDPNDEYLGRQQDREETDFNMEQDFTNTNEDKDANVSNWHLPEKVQKQAQLLQTQRRHLVLSQNWLRQGQRNQYLPARKMSPSPWASKWAWKDLEVLATCVTSPLKSGRSSLALLLSASKRSAGTSAGIALAVAEQIAIASTAAARRRSTAMTGFLPTDGEAIMSCSTD